MGRCCGLAESAAPRREGPPSHGAAAPTPNAPESGIAGLQIRPRQSRSSPACTPSTNRGSCRKLDKSADGKDGLRWRRAHRAYYHRRSLPCPWNSRRQHQRVRPCGAGIRRSDTPPPHHREARAPRRASHHNYIAQFLDRPSLASILGPGLRRDPTYQLGIFPRQPTHQAHRNVIGAVATSRHSTPIIPLVGGSEQLGPAAPPPGLF
jgi:hypothetical protein